MYDCAKPLDQEVLTRVADSFAVAYANGPEMGRLFYDTLFRRCPHLRRLFRGDMDVQSRKLMDTLNVVVASLGHPDVVRPVSEDLARRHLSYGVRPEHYAEVGAILIATLTRFLGPEVFDEGTAAAWKRAYGMLSDTMIAAAYPDVAA